MESSKTANVLPSSSPPQQHGSRLRQLNHQSKERGSNKYKFSTVCRVKRKHKPIFKMAHDHQSLLDSHYSKQAAVSLSLFDSLISHPLYTDLLSKAR